MEPGESIEIMENQTVNRREKRKAAKKEKRRQMRKEMAVRQREESEAKMNDPEEQARLRMMEEEEAERCERERREFEERERMWMEAAAERKRREEEEEEERRKLLEALEKKQVEKENELNEDDDWEYVEEGPAEIIWQGNEIIVKKKKVRVAKKNVDQQSRKEDADRPTSNPLPPQSEFSDHNASVHSSQQVFTDVSEQIPNFGTEQDKAHCPFHIKTGACRFGQRCSRVHFYPDKSCTLLIKNMYNGPGLAWEQDEGLEYTDEEVERCYEEFYEDVHTEFLKFGEIVNFKVCRNGSFHLRGNVYVQYKSLDSAVIAYQSVNGRYFAGKQIKCEFVGVTRWKVAICGEYMKSRLKTCSHGTACNFIHCFRNPGGDYEWADWDKPPPRYWVKKMAALFGFTDESGYDKEAKQESFGRRRNSSNSVTADADRYHSRRSRSRSRGRSYLLGEMARSQYDENDAHKNTHRQRHSFDGRKRIRMHEEEMHFGDDHRSRSRTHDADSDGDLSDKDRDRDRERHFDCRRKSSRHRKKVLEALDDYGERKNRTYDSGGDWSDGEGDRIKKHYHTNNSSKHQKGVSGLLDDHEDIKIGTHKTNSNGDCSDGDGDGDRHHHTRKSLRNRSKASEFSGDHRHSRYRTDVTDSDGDSSERNRQRDRYHYHRRKSPKRWDEELETADDHEDRKKRTHGTDPTGDQSDEEGERHHSKRRKHSRYWAVYHGIPEENSRDEFRSQEFNNKKPNAERVQKHTHKSRKDRSKKEISKADFLSEDLRSNADHEASSSGLHDIRCKSNNLDPRHSSDENSEKLEKRQKHRRQKTGGKNSDSDSPGRYEGRSNSHDPESGCYSGDNMNSQEPKKHVAEKPHTYRYHGHKNENRSRGSSHGSHSTSFKDAESLEEYQESEERNEKRNRKHKSTSHKHWSEKNES